MQLKLFVHVNVTSSEINVKRFLSKWRIFSLLLKKTQRGCVILKSWGFAIFGLWGCVISNVDIPPYFEVEKYFEY